LDHAPVLRDWQLPESFARLRQALEQRHGPRAGARHYVRVLQLLTEHSVESVQAAVETCLRRDECHAECIAAELRRCPDAAGHTPKTALDQFQVPRPDLGRFDQLLSQGESHDG
jgi:hypothetical protein